MHGQSKSAVSGGAGVGQGRGLRGLGLQLLTRRHRTPPAPSSSRLTTEWGEDECAHLRHGHEEAARMVKMSPADGSMCKAETSQAEKCMMPECREWAGGRGLWGR